jgi:L-seryl-tRNA(Ser) seleniumtransferase
MRALRPDKLTLAALAATLALYKAGSLDAIPTARMLGASADSLRAVADALAAAIGAVAGLTIAVAPSKATVGGGAMPTAELASWAVTISGRSADALDKALRAHAIVGRIEDGSLWLDVRTIAPDEHADVAAAVRALG